MVERSDDRLTEGRALLKVKAIGKHFGGLSVLDDASLEVPAGSITGLIGPNGSGKSTLFDIITGYVRPEAGDVEYNGVRLNGLQPHVIASRGLIRTFQLTRIFRSLTVVENLLVCAREGIGSEGLARATQLLEFVGLTPLAEHEASDLSYGQQKLVEIAQVLMLEPGMLLLDEPLAGINPGLADQIADHLRELRRNGVTLLLVEHNLPMVTTLCDRVIVLNAGKVIACGPPDEVVADPTVREAFLGN